MCEVTTKQRGQACGHFLSGSCCVRMTLKHHGIQTQLIQLVSFLRTTLNQELIGCLRGDEGIYRMLCFLLTVIEFFFVVGVLGLHPAAAALSEDADEQQPARHPATSCQPASTETATVKRKQSPETQQLPGKPGQARLYGAGG